MSESKVPEVRFKGFCGEWEESMFIDFIERKSIISNEIGLPRVEYEDIIPQFGKLNKDIYKKESKKTGLLFERGDILFGKLHPYLKNWLISDFCGIAVGDFWILKPNEVVGNFVYYLMQNSTFQYVSNLSSGTKMPRSDWNIVSKSKFSIALNEIEQTKIGDFFKNFDTLIDLNQSKYDKLVNMKKACLDKMFPKDGADTPEVRFKGFGGKWEKICLENYIVEHTQRTSDFIKYPLYSLTIEKGVTEKTDRYERSFLVTKKDDLFKIVPPQCFVANPMNLRFGAIGYNRNSFDISVSGYYDVFSIDESNCSYFWTTYLKTHQLLKKYNDIATGSLIEKRRVHFAAFKKIHVLMPIIVEEKKQIGTFFQNLDHLITLRKTELEKLKNIKKACLDKLFI